MITAACYFHQPIVGYSHQRMDDFSAWIGETVQVAQAEMRTWALLPNHYHLLVKTQSILILLKSLGRLHGRSSYLWNGEENTRGRQVWTNAAETWMRSERHFWATLNYIHHNPVKHGHVSQMSDWKWSGFSAFKKSVGKDFAHEIWEKYPIKNYGDSWDRD